MLAGLLGGLIQSFRLSGVLSFDNLIATTRSSLERLLVVNKTMKTVYIERLKLFKPIQMVMLNNITEIDESFIDDNFELFFTDCEACYSSGEKDGKLCEECGGDGCFDNEFYQYYITDANELEVERLKSYGVDVGYSEKVNQHIICIGDFGTSWSAFSYSKEVPDDYELYPYETLKRLTVY